MSKHQKELRRERRKDEAGRRRRSFLKPQAASLKSAGAALAAAAAIAAGTSAYAEPIRYDNPAGPGHFEWAIPSFSYDDDYLDITQDASSQPTSYGPSSLWSQIGDGFTAGFGAGAPEVEAVNPAGYALLTGLNAGDLIPSGAAWNGYAYGMDYYGYSGLPEGQPSYFGVRFDLGSGFQYGWVGVVREPGSGTLDAFAWGYETTPGVPIAAGVPEPGTLALLAMGAVGVLSRRRS